MLIEAVRECALDHSGNDARASDVRTITKPRELCLMIEFLITYSS
jgi:hypothetical protein